MKILVTGGAGYIGSIAHRYFLDAGHEVVVLDSLERGHRAAVDSRATLVIASVNDADVLDAILPGTDAVVHFAGYIDVAESIREPELYHQKIVHEPTVLLQRVVAAKVRRFVFSSTAAVYGQPERMPVTDDCRLSPLSPYGFAKAEFERLLMCEEFRGTLMAARLRYFNVAGAWPDGSIGEAHPNETHIIPTLLRAAAAGADGGGNAHRFTVFGDDYPTPDGTCVRDYVHVMDLAKAHLAAVEYLVGGGYGIDCNLGSGRGYSNLEVARTCAAVTGREIEVVRGPRRPGDPAMLVAAIDGAKEYLGWAPERDLTTMVTDAWRWHQSHPEGYGS